MSWWRVKWWFRYDLPNGVADFCGWLWRGCKPKPSPVMGNIRVFAEMMDHWPDDDDVARAEKILSRDVYKSTSCGAWLAFIKTPAREKTIEARRYVAMISQANGHLGVDKLFRATGDLIRPDLEPLPFNPANPTATWPREVLEYLLLVCPEGWDETKFKFLGSHTIGELFGIGKQLQDEKWTSTGPDKGTYEFTVSVAVPLDPRDTPPYGIWGIQLGSIVEGEDVEVNADPLYFPFTLDEYQETVKFVEDEVERIWSETHGCVHCFTKTACDAKNPEDECNKDTASGGQIDPDCLACGGEGATH